MDNNAKEKECLSDEECREKIHKMIDEIDNSWLLRQVLKLMLNLKK